MLRLTGVFLLIFSCAQTGYCMERSESKRLSQLEILSKGIEYLKREIEFAHLTIPEAMTQVGGRSSPPFQNLFFRLSKELKLHSGKALKEILGKVVEEESKNWELTPKDIKQFYDACSQLGYLDKNMQIHLLEQYEKDLQTNIEQLRKELPKKKKLYRSLGLLGGIFLAIVLV